MPARLGALVFLVFATGCGGKLEAPPVEVTHRESLLGAGRIVRIKNQTNEALFDVAVTIRTANGEVGYNQAELPGFETLEVGWKKLGGFEIPDGAEVEVKAEGYMLPVKAKLDAAKPNEGDGGSS